VRPRPRSAHPALGLLEAELARLDTEAGLERAAVAVSRLVDPAAEPLAWEREVDRLAALVRARLPVTLPCARPQAILAHAHAALFDEGRLRGNREAYYDPDNSAVTLVLTRGVGIPITLCLCYKSVLRRLGVAVRGVNAPGHFLAAVDDRPGGAPLLVDVYAEGRTLTRGEAVRRVESALGPAAPARRTDPLPVASHRAWLLRMLRNLCAIYHGRGARRELRACLDLVELLGERP
jgi:regulator of sirC expression with transglutaminase-like and TPR domain